MNTLNKDQEHFKSKIEIQPDTKCWVWTAASRSGSGLLTIDRKNVLAHVFSYETYVGPLKGGNEIIHTCGKTLCVNPEHLSQVPKGDPMGRFHSRYKINEETGCWEWIGTLWQSSGYARFKVKGKEIPAHRFSYQQLIGPIPEGLVLDHLCRNKGCVNPAHLEPVTSYENILRGDSSPVTKNASQLYCPQGHPMFGEHLYLRKARYGWNGKTRTCLECKRILNRKVGARPENIKKRSLANKRRREARKQQQRSENK